MRRARDERGRRRPWWWPGKYTSTTYPIPNPDKDPLDYDGRRCQALDPTYNRPCIRRWDHVNREREATGVALHRWNWVDDDGEQHWFEWREN